MGRACRKKAAKPKEEIKSNLDNGKLCLDINIRILLLFHLCICEMEFKLLSIIVCTKVCVQLRAFFCTLTHF